MNIEIKDAIISNLKATFPNSTIYDGKVIQGIKANDIIVNTAYDNVEFFLGSSYRQRHSIASISFINPTEDIIDALTSCLQILTTDNDTVYPTSVEVRDMDGMILALVDLTHLEQ